jgi:hypothetical protein
MKDLLLWLLTFIASFSFLYSLCPKGGRDHRFFFFCTFPKNSFQCSVNDQIIFLIEVILRIYTLVCLTLCHGLCSSTWKVWLVITEITQEKMVTLWGYRSQVSFLWYRLDDASETLMCVRNPLGINLKWSFWFSRSGWVQRICISNKLLGNVVTWGHTLNSKVGLLFELETSSLIFIGKDSCLSAFLCELWPDYGSAIFVCVFVCGAGDWIQGLTHAI